MHWMCFRKWFRWNKLFRYPIADWQYKVIDEHNPFIDYIPPLIQIVYPEKNAFYIFGYKILSPENKTIIIGYPRQLIVDAEDESGIRKVEFYINDGLVKEDFEEPFVFNISKGCYIAKVTAYDLYMNFATDEMNICLFYIT